MIEQKITEIEETFELFDDWTDKYQYIVELGSKLLPLDNLYKIEENLVRGCQSQVWLISKKEGENLFYYADSDAIITKGLAALLIEVLSGNKAEDIANADLKFLERIGLGKHLSPSRANGFFSMIQKIKSDAVKNLIKT